MKVRFHWDRAERNGEDRSCWVRVAQAWAGKGWGAMVLPRIGQEVVVSFLEGDPDRPLVTGCVYNAAQTVPYPLPGGQTRSTFRSSSSPGGAAYSEIRFEDKKDVEELYLYAGRDLTVDVVHDRTATVQQGNDTLVVKKGTRTVKVQGAETHANGATFTHTTGGDYLLSVTGNLSISATGSITLSAGTSLQAAAGTTLTATGGISAEVSSDGVSTVKGALVKVNA